MFEVIEPEGRLDEDGSFGIGKVDDLIEKISKERVGLFVLEFGHGNVFVIVEFLKADFFENEVVFLHIGVTIYEFFELFVKHLESVDMNKVLNVFKTHFETVKIGTQLYELLLECLGSPRVYRNLFLQYLGDKSDELFSYSCLQQLSGVDLHHS